IYLASNATNETGGDIITIEVEKQNPTITIEVNNTNVIIGESVTISGVVTDQLGNTVMTGDVTVYINGTEYPTTIDDGVYAVVNVTGVAGIYTVNATYHGNDTVNPVNSSNVQFTVEKINTFTNVTILNNTVGNVTIDVVVTENEEESSTHLGYSDVITNGTIRVTVDGESQDFTITSRNTTIVLNVNPIRIDTTEQVEVQVEYLENWKYLGSIGVDSDTGEDLTEINADPVASNVTINVTPNPQNITRDVTISGRVYTDLGDEVTSGQVEVTVDGNYLGFFDLSDE
ncbi:MAG: hypothetical protein BZ137_09905, partial [Methanosphaera sp. rholeuAM130]